MQRKNEGAVVRDAVEKRRSEPLPIHSLAEGPARSGTSSPAFQLQQRGRYVSAP